MKGETPVTVTDPLKRKLIKFSQVDVINDDIKPEISKDKIFSKTPEIDKKSHFHSLPSRFC